MIHFYTWQKYKNEKRATRQNRGDAYGNWYSTSWEIRQNELPEAVNNTLNNQYGEYRFDEAEYIEKADGSIYYRIELEKGDVDKVVNIGENGTVLSQVKVHNSET